MNSTRPSVSKPGEKLFACASLRQIAPGCTVLHGGVSAAATNARSEDIMSDEDTMSDYFERQLADLAAYHVGLFVGSTARIEGSPAVIAHALFLLIEQANQRRVEWVKASESPPPGDRPR
jgi:hypothetical protein